MIRSQAIASDMPAPAAAPSTAAITGFGQSVIARVMRFRPSIESAWTSGGFDRFSSRRLRLPPGAERAVGAGQHDGPDCVVGGGLRERGHQRVVGLGGRGALRKTGVGERQDERRTAAFRDHGGSHRISGIVSDTPSSARRRVSHGDGR